VRYSLKIFGSKYELTRKENIFHFLMKAFVSVVCIPCLLPILLYLIKTDSHSNHSSFAYFWHVFLISTQLILLIFSICVFIYSAIAVAVLLTTTENNDNIILEKRRQNKEAGLPEYSLVNKTKRLFIN